jgi:putative flippase GtrA
VGLRRVRARRRASAAPKFLRFCAVGATGYAVNLAVYAALLAAGLHYVAAATVSFLVAAASNYPWNRTWTFQTSRAPLVGQGDTRARRLGTTAGADECRSS